MFEHFALVEMADFSDFQSFAEITLNKITLTNNIEQNNIEPNTLPCRTPRLTLSQAEKVCPTLTLCCGSLFFQRL